MTEKRWCLNFFDRLEARYGEEDYFRFPTVHTQRILVLLVVSKSLQSREEIASILWPDREIAAARKLLNKELDRLKGAWREKNLPPFIHITRSTLHVALEYLDTDLGRWERQLLLARRANAVSERIQHLRQASSIYAGELAHGLEFEYIEPRRREYATRHLNTLMELSRTLMQYNDITQAIHYARTASQVAPLDEDPHALLIRLYQIAGQPDEARRVLRDYKRQLKRELQMSPSKELASLLSTSCASSFSNRALAPIGAADFSGELLLSLRLPYYSDLFFDREDEIKSILQLLHGNSPNHRSPVRLLTLYGPPGSGKTRLSVECANRFAQYKRIPAWFVPLTHISHPSYLLQSIHAALGLPPSENTPLLEQIASYLQQHPGLLILDNMEHLLEWNATRIYPSDGSSMARIHEILTELLQNAPSLNLLVTSRAPTGHSNEYLFPLMPLPYVAQSQLQSAIVEGALYLDTVRRVPSLALFESRARRVKARFGINRRNILAVCSICQWLEGIPLAIEIAAYRVRSYSPAEIFKQIQSSLLSLRNSVSTAIDRHRTLKLTIQGSYQLLDTGHQQLFASLAVFQGGWDLEAAEAICTPLALSPIREALALLVNTSLLSMDSNTQVPRYRLLHIMQEFANAKLEATEQEHTVRERHALYFIQIAENAAPHLWGRDGLIWLEKLVREQENFRVALTWLHAKRRIEEMLRLSVALSDFWHLRGLLAEGRRWFTLALEGNPPFFRNNFLPVDIALSARFISISNRPCQLTRRHLPCFEKLEIAMERVLYF